MAEQKTKETKLSVKKFLGAIPDKQIRDDCYAISDMMESITKAEPKMWGTAIVGFGSYHYKYESGHEGDACLLGFSPRKKNITLYLMGGFHSMTELMSKLGKHKTGKGCLYINTLEDVDVKVLKTVIKGSLAALKEQIKVMKKKECEVMKR
ncbi:MAG: DUF1801 domain-containing protein [Bacteroidota bacterium]|nr:DUF1801 domain-containing protein [Bacteroidota bacterium]